MFPPDSIGVCYLFSTIFTLRLFLSVRLRYILVTLIKCSFGSMSSHHTPYWFILFIIPISTRRKFLFSLSFLFSLTYLLSICFSAYYVTTIKKKTKTTTRFTKLSTRTQQRAACSNQSKNNNWTWVSDVNRQLRCYRFISIQVQVFRYIKRGHVQLRYMRLHWLANANENK